MAIARWKPFRYRCITSCETAHEGEKKDGNEQRGDLANRGTEKLYMKVEICQVVIYGFGKIDADA